MTLSWRGLVGLLVAGCLSGSSFLALQQPQPQSISSGVYTEQQAAAGQKIYAARCANCHGQNLAGRTGPPLAGSDFLANWDTQPLVELANKVFKTMPKDETARLTREEAAAVLAYMLQTGKFPSGRTELVMDDAALKVVNFPARPASAQVASAAPAQQPALPVAGNLAQVMRGILFPSSNIVFTVQSIDPGVRKAPAEDSGAGGFDWLTWGGSVYRGWDVVDYAAISLAESATLMLTPGRRCENGRPVPVNDPDWIKFSLQLADAGKAAYKASQTRNQEIVSESTNQLNASCSNCHRVFRGRTHCVKP